MSSLSRHNSTQFSCRDQNMDLASIGMTDYDLQTAIVTTWKQLDIDLAEFGAYIRNIPGIQQVTDQNGRVIIKLINVSDNTEYFHLSLFTKNDRYGGLHLTCYPDKKLYLTNEEVLFCCGMEEKYIILNLFKTLIYYLEHQKRWDNSELSDMIKNFMFCCHKDSDSKKKDIIRLLKLLHTEYNNFTPLTRYCTTLARKTVNRDRDRDRDREREGERERDKDERGRDRLGGSGGSTKVVLYLIKIEKLRELNKKLRKNKTKYKNKIQKNNKQIDELKIKIKKEKAKAKEKLKKEKAKKKLKKVKVKKVHISKKIKK